MIAIKIPFFFFVTRVRRHVKIDEGALLSIALMTIQDKHSDSDQYGSRSNKTLQTSKPEGTDEVTSIKNSRIRIQLPKLEVLDVSGLIPQANHHDPQSNGFSTDSELGGK